MGMEGCYFMLPVIHFLSKLKVLNYAGFCGSKIMLHIFLINTDNDNIMQKCPRGSSNLRHLVPSVGLGLAQ